jgi:uncharacterized protein (DUF1501 family)
MNRRKFLNLAGTSTGGFLLMPEFLLATEKRLIVEDDTNDNILVFIQLNGGNDGLNTVIPYADEAYYTYRRTIAIDKKDVNVLNKNLGLHPDMKGFQEIAQNGDLTILQNVGYPNPNRSHFRSRDIWNTASNSNEILDHGWLGRFLHHHHPTNPLGYINLDNVENLAIKSPEVLGITINDVRRLNNSDSLAGDEIFSDNPILDYALRISRASIQGAQEISEAMRKSKSLISDYGLGTLSHNLKWIYKVIAGGLQTRVYYATQNGYDTHSNQKRTQASRLNELNNAVFGFYNDLKRANLLHRVTLVIFSEFGRRVKENGTGTDHGTAGPMFIIGGKNKGKIIGKNPDLINLDNGDLIYDIDFRSVYSSILSNKFNVNPNSIGIKQNPLSSIF